jgi:two-component system, LuxR family, sensor kinase FixL
MDETKEDLTRTIEDLQARLDAAEEALRAIRSGEVDALVIYGQDGDHVYTLEGADYTYRMMVEKIQEGVATLQPDGMILYANRRLAEMLGERLESLLGSSLSKFVQPPDQKFFSSLLRKGVEGGGKAEMKLLCKDGSTLPALLSMTSVESSGRQMIGLIATDLTEQKRHEEILAAERLAHAILDQAAEGIVVCDENGIIIRASQAAQKILSYNPIFQRFEKAFPLKFPETGEREEPFSIVAALAGRSFQGVEAQLSQVHAGREGGDERQENLNLLLSAAPLRNDWGEILGCTVTLTNITELKQAERALQEGETRLRKLVEGNIIGITIRDTAGVIHDANSVFLNLVGRTWEDLRAGKLSIRDMTPKAFWEVDRQAIAEALATGSCKPYEKEFLHKDGHPIPVMVGYTCIDEGSGDFIGFVLDLTRLKKAQTDLVAYAEKLKRSNMELEQFAFVASHDMQEPLRKIIRFGDSVSDRLKTELDEATVDEISDYVRRMQKAADRLQAMIDGLLELSRISTQGQGYEWVNLGQVAAQVISDIELLIHQTGAQIDLGQLPTIQADPIQMHQLMQNLITNALKFHAPEVKPTIKIRGDIDDRGTSNSDKYVHLEVADNGIGFDEQDAKWIFQPFRRLHGAQEYEGSGMGLAICLKIVERHHGSIKATSQPGKGSTFLVELPLQRRDAS